MRAFADRLLPAPRDGGFAQDNYWVWCGSAARGEDGRYHLFAARWPRALPFFQGYLAASEVVRASADAAVGPYRFEQTVLPARGAEHWDGRMTHNPHILRVGDRWWLFYIGATYAEEPTLADLQAAAAAGRGMPWYGTIRIGVATAPTVFGPWERSDRPLLDVAPGAWDHNVTTNPCPCLAPDGRLLLYYRSGECRLGLAVAQRPGEPFERPFEHPVLDPGPGRRIEDPFVWWDGQGYQMIAKDLTGELAGELHAGVHLGSDDGVAWSLAQQPRAWSRRVLWQDGSTTELAHLERPFVLFEDGLPTTLFAAVADGPGPRDGRPGWCFASRSWTAAIPLRSW